MKLQLMIDMGNAAFEDDAGEEISRILVKIIQDMKGQERDHLTGYERKLLDSNGNAVGKAKVIP